MRKKLLTLLVILYSLTSCTYYHGFSPKEQEQKEMYFGDDTITVYLSAVTKWPGRPGKFEARFSVNSWNKEDWPKDSIVFDSMCIKSLESDYEKCQHLRGQGVSSASWYLVEIDEVSLPKIDSFIFSFDAIAIDRISRKEVRRERFARKFRYYKRTAWFDH